MTTMPQRESTIAAPAEDSAKPASIAAAWSTCLPPSEKLSGVTLRMPINCGSLSRTVRSPSCSAPRGRSTPARCLPATSTRWSGIATTQSAQKGEFYDWLVKWNLPQRGGPLMAWMDASDSAHQHGAASASASDDDLMAQMGMASAADLAQLRAESGAAADCTFLRLMIRHHEGAVPMAEALLDLGSEPRALQVAESIRATQSAEIDLMTSLRAGLACTD